MDTEKGTAGGWGYVLILAAGLWVGCSPRTEIGEAGQAGTGGGTDSGGTAGSVTGGSGNGSEGGADSPVTPAEDCFELMTAYGPPPQLSPDNMVLASARRNTNTLLNYADEVVFDPPSWELGAMFPASDRSDDTSIQLPEELSQISENRGEVYITRPACRGRSAAGRTVRVYAWWRLDGAIGRTPIHGIALGTTDGESFADATEASPLDGSQETRPLNRRLPIVLEHSFSASDTTDAGDLVLKLWLLENFDFSSTLYINRVEWE
jgi:hypothetical protein